MHEFEDPPSSLVNGHYKDRLLLCFQYSFHYFYLFQPQRLRLGWPKWPKCVGPTGPSGFPILVTQLVRKMYWNHQKVSGLYLLKSNQDMAIFSKGLELKNDIVCLRPFLTPLVGSKTSTNIWKHIGTSQNTFQDTKSTKIGPLDGILALLQKFLSFNQFS